MGVDVPASGPLGGSAPAAHSVRGWVGGVDERRSGLRGQLRRSSTWLARSLSPRYDLRPSSSLRSQDSLARRAGRRRSATKPVRAPCSGSVSRHVRLSDRLGHPRRRRRHPARRRGQAGDRLVGRLAVGPGPPGQHARVPHRALRRRRAAPPRGARAPPARVGRLRPVPQGARGRRPVVRRPHRPPAERRPRPVGLPRLVGRALQGAPPRRPARDGHRDGGDLPDRALHLRALPRAGAARRPAPSRHRGGARPLPHEEGRARARSPSRRPRRWPTASPTTRTPRARPSWSGSRSSRTAARADATPPPSRPTTTTRTDLAYTCDLRAHPHHQPRHAERGQAGVEGRLADALGLRARRLRAGRHGPRDARLVVHRRPRAGREGLRDAAAGLVRLRLRRLRRRAEDVVVRGWRAHRRGRPARAGGADPALALRAPQPQADLRHRLRPRGRPALRRVGLPGPQGRRPRQARRSRCSPGNVRRPRPPARCRRRGSSYRSACCPRSPTSPPARPSRSAGSSATRSTTSSRASTRRWRGPASTSTRPTARPCARPPTRPRSPRSTTEQRDLAAAAARRARRAAASSTPSRRWSTACPSWRAGWPSTTSRPTRSRPTRRSSSGCSTACWSTPSAARGCPRW